MPTIIINGGNPLGDCPTSYDIADKWAQLANDELGDNGLQWKFDCGYKLDFDGSLVTISSRFYPPKTHYGPTWDGTVTILYQNGTAIERKFDEPTLDKLKEAVHSFIKQIKITIEFPE